MINSSMKYLDTEGSDDSKYITNKQSIFKVINDETIISNYLN